MNEEVKTEKVEGTVEPTKKEEVSSVEILADIVLTGIAIYATVKVGAILADGVLGIIESRAEKKARKEKEAFDRAFETVMDAYNNSDES